LSDGDADTAPEGAPDSLMMYDLDGHSWLSKLHKAWKITKCAVVIVLVVESLWLPASRLLRIRRKIRELGGFKDAARLVVGATNRSEKLEAIAKIGLTLSLGVSGVDLIVSNCK
jgi:hypothetical protein